MSSEETKIVEEKKDGEKVEYVSKEEEEEEEKEVEISSTPKRNGPDTNVVSATIVAYEGDRDEETNAFHGIGKATFLGGNVYEGTFENNVMNGEGSYYFQDGTYVVERYVSKTKG